MGMGIGILGIGSGFRDFGIGILGLLCFGLDFEGLWNQSLRDKQKQREGEGGPFLILILPCVRDKNKNREKVPCSSFSFSRISLACLLVALLPLLFAQSSLQERYEHEERELGVGERHSHPHFPHPGPTQVQGWGFTPPRQGSCLSPSHARFLKEARSQFTPKKANVIIRNEEAAEDSIFKTLNSEIKISIKGRGACTWWAIGQYQISTLTLPYPAPCPCLCRAQDKRREIVPLEGTSSFLRSGSKREGKSEPKARG